MNLSECPERRVLVLARFLDLEDFGEIGLVLDLFEEVINKFWLRERVLVIHRQIA